MAGGRDPTRKRVIHMCSGQSKWASNAAVLMGAYMIYEMDLKVEEIMTIFKKGKSNLFQPFLDAGKNPSGTLRVQDCLKALEWAKARNLFNPRIFDEKEFDRLADPTRFDSGGDMAWLLPGKLLLMSSPSMNMAEGQPPHNYIDYFKKMNVSAIVRLNEKLYVDEDFYRHGIRVYPMEIEDNTVPTENELCDFLMVCDLEVMGRAGAVAVHCRSG